MPVRVRRRNETITARRLEAEEIVIVGGYSFRIPVGYWEVDADGEVEYRSPEEFEELYEPVEGATTEGVEEKEDETRAA